MPDTSKRLKSLVRQWAAVAHDKELSQALLALRGHFDRWQGGEISAADLNHFVHEYHQNESREIWRRYATNHLEPTVAGAVASGLLPRNDLPAELLEHLERWIQLYQAESERGRTSLQENTES